MSKIRDHQSTQPVIRFKGFTDAWEKRKLGNLAEIVRGASPRPIQDPKWFDSSSEIGWLRIADVTEQNGRIHHLEQHISKAGQEKTRVLTQPHLLLSIAATVGKPLINYVSTGVHDGFLIFLKPKFELEFMYQWLEYFRPYWQKYGQPGSQVNLNSELVRNQSLHLPVVEEQIKIGHFLDKLNNLIAVNQRKGDVLQNLKKGLLQRLFASETSPIPDIRFKGFTDAWEKRKLGALLTERNVQHPQNSEYPLVSFTVEHGVTPKTERYEREQLVRGDKQAKKYKETRLNDIVYNPANLKFGAIARNSFGKAVFSPIYVTFEVNERTVLAQFMEMIVTRGIFIKEALRYQQGTVYERQSVNQHDLLSLNAMLPEKDEQMDIASTFSKLDNLIAATQRKGEVLKNLKKALLQKMFV